MPATYIVSWAQNATPVHARFLAALKHYPGKLTILAGRYKNPTSVWTDKDKGDQWYDDAVVPYLTEARQQLCPNLCLYGDIHVLPTAARPLSTFEVFCGANSAIFGHPKRALEVVPTATRMPRLLATTGACTIASYTDSKAGKKGEAHHVLGALVVEVEDDGTYHMRHVSGLRDGSFIDLDTLYTAEGKQPAPPALVLTLGDVHVGQEDPAVLAATRSLVRQVQPKHIVLHDVLDFRSRNHHDKGLRLNLTKLRESKHNVRNEVGAAANALHDVAAWGKHRVWVIRSNHDEALDRWLEECEPHKDPENAPYYFALWSRMCDYHEKHGEWPNPFALEARRLGVSKRVRFLGRDQDVRIKGVSYGFHGDKGINGARGNPNAYAKLGVKTVTGHTHTPRIVDGNYTAGVTARLDHGYNLLPSSWLNAHVLQYANGKRAMIVIVRGRYTTSERQAA
jgi:hypothetical protein